MIIKPDASRKADWELPASVKKKWLTALRSGKYKQGKTQLYNKNTKSYCCLGLLGKVCGATNSQMNEVELPENIMGGFRKMFEDADDWGVPVIAKDGGESNRIARYEVYALNDDFMLSFEEIADIIEVSVGTYIIDATVDVEE